MTTEVDVNTDSFRTNWAKCSLSCKYDAATSSSREIGKPIDDIRYAALQARIQRLHESFDAWCEGGPAEHHDVPTEHALAEVDSL